ncbi:hypothetical protein C8K15_14411 [Paenisporosarcina sp. OV554]|nr:hypothetical protein C8K15_14411 [Paenisporosarcina sp. OV554]
MNKGLVGRTENIPIVRGNLNGNFILYIGWFIISVLCIVFYLNLVTIMKKVKNEENTSKNTIWLTISFLFIMWSIAILASTAKQLFNKEELRKALFSYAKGAV